MRRTSVIKEDLEGENEAEEMQPGKVTKQVLNSHWKSIKSKVADVPDDYLVGGD